LALLLLHAILPAALALALLLYLLRRLAPSLVQNLPTLWLPLALVLLLTYTAALACTLYLPIAIDPIEVTVTGISALWLHHQPIYTTLDAPARYSLLYGPLCYLPFAAALKLFGATMATLKLTIVACNALLFIALWLALRHHLRPDEALIALAFAAATLLMKAMSTLQVRGDAPLAAAVALALLAITLHRRVPAAILFALAAALAVDIKFTAAFSLLVPLYLLYKRHGPVTTSISLTLAAILAAAPFALPNISLPNYLAWIHQASHHPLGLKLFAMNVIACLILLTPLALLSTTLDAPFQTLRRHWPLAALFALTLAGSALTGSKIGAGRSHLNGAFLVATYLAALLWSHRSRTKSIPQLLPASAAVYSLFLLLPSLSQLNDLRSICLARRAWAISVAGDVDYILRSHPHQAIEIAYNQVPTLDEPIDPLTAFRTTLVLAGNPFTADAGALSDMGLSGLSVPASTTAYLRSCGTQIWLVPAGGEPFSATNLYVPDIPHRFPDPHLFPQPLRNAFAATYTHTSSTQYFDLYTCNNTTR